jgi:hypothetical protein
MDLLEEWKFEFSVSAPEPIPYQMMDDLMWLEAVPWAENRRLGIGGGFGPAAKRLVDSDRLWHFSFGLSVQQGGQLIPRSLAYELFEALTVWCKDRNLSFRGGFREYTPEELGLTEADNELSDI